MSDAPAMSLADQSAVRPSFRPKRTFAQQVIRETLTRWGARLGLTWIAIVAVLAVFAPYIANSHPFYMVDAEGHWSIPILRWLTPADVFLLLAFFATLIFTIGWRKRYAISQNLMAAAWIAAAVTPAIMQAVVRREWAAGQYGVGTGVIVTLITIATPFWLAIVIWPMLRMRWSIPFRAGLLVAAGVFWVLLFLFPVNPPAVFTDVSYRERLANGDITYAIFAPIPYSPNDAMQGLPSTTSLAPGWYPRDPDSPALSEAERKRIAFAREHGEPLPNEYLSAEGEKLESRLYLMGTAPNGLDIASRMIHGCRIALTIGFIATGIAVTIGIVVGGVLGYFAGLVDLIGLRIVEIIAAIPVIFLLIAIVAFYGRNIYLIMSIIGLTGWVGYALYIRAEFLRLRKQDFVQAAVACGLPLHSILFRHMLPNGIAPVLVQASFGVASAILVEATLSFLGLGLVDEPSWGQLLNQAREGGGQFYWWIALFPSLAIFLTVYSYNLVGEALRDAIDPHLKKAAAL